MQCLAVGHLDHTLIPGPMQTLKTQHRQAHTTVRRNRPRLTPHEEGGLASLRILELSKSCLAFTLILHFELY
jgi:hypothetical protein